MVKEPVMMDIRPQRRRYIVAKGSLGKGLAGNGGKG